jgi:heme-degrading monooxygenase HmoA
LCLRNIAFVARIELAMTTIGMNYQVLAGKEKEFEHAFLAVLQKLQGVAGHVDSKLYQDVASQGSYLIFSQWQSKSDFDAFVKSEAFAKVTSWGKAEILRGRPLHTVYNSD